MVTGSSLPAWLLSEHPEGSFSLSFDGADVVLESTPTNPGSGSASLRQPTAPTGIAGRHIRISASVRTEDVTGVAQLAVRVRSPGSVTLGEDHVTGTRNWTHLTAELDAAKDADAVQLFITLSGTGRMFVKHLACEIVDPSGSHPLPELRDLDFAQLAIKHRPVPDEAIEALRSCAHHVTSIRIGSDFEDLDILQDLVSDAKIVALGEATHGSREFFQAKGRLLEFLVAEMGFTGIAIEAGFANCLAVDEYILDGQGTAADALAGLGTWVYRTEELLELVEWMRTWNLAHSDTPVRFYGFDMQDPLTTSTKLISLLDMLEPTLAELARDTLAPVWLTPSNLRQFLPDALHAQTAEFVRQIETFLEELADVAASAPESRTHATARLLARVLAQSVHMGRGQTPSTWRDECMADNVTGLLTLAGPDSKLVLSAHNGHIVKTEWLRDRMGTILRRRFGPDYRAIAFTFHRGAFQAIDQGDGLLKEHLVEPPSNQLLEAALHRLNLPLAVLDTAQLPSEGAAADWFAMPPAMRYIGAPFSPAVADVTQHTDIRTGYDALLYIEETTRSRPLPPMPTPASTATHLHPVNLDFQDSLTGWQWSCTGAGDATIEHDPSHANWCVLRLHPEGNQPGFGGLRQTFDATPFRGRHVEVSVTVAVQTTGFGLMALLQAHTLQPNAPATRSRRPAGVWIADPIRVPNPTTVTISADVPPAADLLTIAFHLQGAGEARLTPIQLTS